MSTRPTNSNATIASATELPEPSARGVAGPPVPGRTARLGPQDIAGAVLAFGVVYLLLRPRQAAAREPEVAPDLGGGASAWRRAPARGAETSTANRGGREAHGAAARGVGAAETRSPSVRGLGRALLTSGALRQGARWLWQGARLARQGAAIRRTAERTGLGRAAHLAARVEAWRDRYALAKTRHALDQDMRALRNAVRRRR